MKTITVTASRNYQVLIGTDLLSNLGRYVKEVSKAQKVAIISDSNVWPIYGETVTSHLQNAGYHTCGYHFTAGEEQKNGNTYLNILNFLAENRISRGDLLIALGGGVVGDITGFAAATYLRGIQYIQIPTTLLSMVDSSVGGKTAIDLPAGKNLAGAFYQPSLVICDVNTLNTLPDEIFRDGCAEVIKYGILFDRELFLHLADTGLSFERENVVSRCVELKRNVVAEDEFDRGTRQLLNLGHTIGHGVEAKSNFEISHGQAVAIGTAIVSKAALSDGICNVKTYEQISQVLNKFSLPTKTQFSAEDLYTCALSDKKRTGNTVNLIVPKEIGACMIMPTSIDSLKSFIEAGL